MRRWLIAVSTASLAVATSCASERNADSSLPPRADQTATSMATATDASSTEGPPRRPEPPNAGTPAPAVGAGSTSTPAPRQHDSIDVDDGALPPEIMDAFANAGGDLVLPDQWARRFGAPAGFPELHGSSGRVVEALSRVEATDDGWRRTDELSWLVLDGRSRDELLADVAAGLGAVGAWESTTTIDEGAHCAVAQLPPISDADWTVQGCSYPRFADLLALGVTRSVRSIARPDVLDASVVAVAASLGGRTAFSEVRLAQPSTDGSTLRLSAQVRFDVPVDVDASIELLSTEALPGWQVLKGEGSVLLSGPTGATWTVTPTVAVFEWAGRW